MFIVTAVIAIALFTIGGALCLLRNKKAVKAAAEERRKFEAERQKAEAERQKARAAEEAHRVSTVRAEEVERQLYAPRAANPPKHTGNPLGLEAPAELAQDLADAEGAVCEAKEDGACDKLSRMIEERLRPGYEEQRNQIIRKEGIEETCDYKLQRARNGRRMYNSVFEMHCNKGGQAGAGPMSRRRSSSNSPAFSKYRQKIRAILNVTAEAAGPVEQGHRELASLYKEAAEIRPKARKAMEHLAAKCSQQGAKLKDMPRLKRTTCAAPLPHRSHSPLAVERLAPRVCHRSRAYEKIVLQPREDGGARKCGADRGAAKIFDIVRDMFEGDAMDDLVELLDLIAKSDEIEVVRVKDRFSNPSPGGWRDVMINYRVKGHRHICEVQIVHSKMLIARKELGGHDEYAAERSARELLEYLEGEGNEKAREILAQAKKASENIDDQKAMSKEEMEQMARKLREENRKELDALREENAMLQEDSRKLQEDNAMLKEDSRKLKRQASGALMWQARRLSTVSDTLAQVEQGANIDDARAVASRAGALRQWRGKSTPSSAPQEPVDGAAEPGGSSDAAVPPAPGAFASVEPSRLPPQTSEEAAQKGSSGSLERRASFKSAIQQQLAVQALEKAGMEYRLHHVRPTRLCAPTPAADAESPRACVRRIRRRFCPTPRKRSLTR